MAWASQKMDTTGLNVENSLPTCRHIASYVSNTTFHGQVASSILRKKISPNISLIYGWSQSLVFFCSLISKKIFSHKINQMVHFLGKVAHLFMFSYVSIHIVEPTLTLLKICFDLFFMQKAHHFFIIIIYWINVKDKTVFTKRRATLDIFYKFLVYNMFSNVHEKDLFFMQKVYH
jgi:hypothetical protein